MKKSTLTILFAAFLLKAGAQGLHFSQYNNAPMLMNPANTGLLQDNDWRAGVNFRNQWATVPVPYNTFSVFADCGLMRSAWETSWLGAGLGIWRDVAGNGNLALTKIQGNLAYHVLMSDNSSLSAGLGAAYNQRSVDFSKLTYDAQWDEFSFNQNLPSNETNLTKKSSFLDLSAGMNFAYYNNSNLYMKLSVGARNVNQPVETFYGSSNRLGLRPMANFELTYKASDNVIINPSVYYSRQKKASELVGGSMFSFNVGENRVAGNNEFMIGAFYRNGDAVIGAAGYKFRQHKVTFSYDHTVSQMSSGNKGLGAFELSLILQGNYKPGNEILNTYGCPRF
ncbi:MAG TPA: PorP/SprF family type IX secretion system membrane protein [Chitinophagaceae bacterium]|nr:PorP/SprF family type IX secretion system membrane protein [Chitinophagaceae bacterium]